MIWDRVQSDWTRFKVNAKQRWSKLGEQELHAIAGRRDLLAARIRDSYSLSVEEAEGQLADWQAGLDLLPRSRRPPVA